jgi:hypothetical protein
MRITPCKEGEFNSLPDHMRHKGPWQGMRRGEIEKLKPKYRLALARDGSVPSRWSCSTQLGEESETSERG